MYFKGNRKFTDDAPNGLERFKANVTLYMLNLCRVRESHITLKDWPLFGVQQDRSNTYTPPTNTTLFIDQAIELGKPCSSRDKTAKLSTAT